MTGKKKESKFYNLSSINNRLLNSVLVKLSILRHTELVSASYKFDKILKQVQNDETYIIVNQYFNNRNQVYKKIRV